MRTQCIKNYRLSSLNNQKLFHGVHYPLASSVITNSIVFGVNSRVKKNVENTWYRPIVSGVCIGTIVSPIIYVFDVAKNKKQVFGRSVDIREDFVKKCGLGTTFVREPIAFSLYFLTYEYMKSNGYHTMVSGGSAGIINWFFTYPIDVLRNRQITHNIDLTEAMNHGKLWNGLGLCLVRAALVNSVGFYTYENLTSLCRD